MERLNAAKDRSQEQETTSYSLTKNKTHIIISPILSSQSNNSILPAIFSCEGIYKEPLLVLHRGSVHADTATNHFFVSNPFPQIMPGFNPGYKDEFLNSLRKFIDGAKAKESLKFYLLQYPCITRSAYRFKSLSEDLLEFMSTHNIAVNNKRIIRLNQYPKKLKIEFQTQGLRFSIV